MFDPTSYRDTDFGLDRGESFEPEDADKVPPVDVRKPHVMTVLGPIDPDDLGVCLSYAHILWEPEARDALQPESQNPQPDRAIDELESFAFAGGRSIVDALTADAGRDAAALYRLAQRVPLHIIASTGRQNRIPLTDPGDADAIARELVRELTSGMDDTSALAGIISVGTKTATIDEIETVKLRAAANAHLATGAPVAVQLRAVTLAHQILDALQRDGVEPDRVILQHVDQESSMDMLTGVAERGPWISFDHIGRRDSADDVAIAGRIVRLFEAGFGDRILTAQDRVIRISSGGADHGVRLTYLLEWFTLTLMEAGADAALVRSLLIDNPGQALAIVPQEGERAPVAG